MMAVAAAMITVEMLRFGPMSHRSQSLFNALAAASSKAHVKTAWSDTYKGEAEWLLIWGPGAPDRFAPMQRHLELGGHVVAFDLAYWDRDQKARVSIDGAHPQAWVMRRDWPTSRLKSDGIAISDAWNPKGPVIVAGIGRKARVQYGEAVDAWEQAQIRACAGRQVRYRVKPGHSQAPPPPGLPLASGSIERALAGASLLVTWHSNVAVDAIRMGIPVVCRDGAAAAVCPSVVTPEQRPLSNDVRDRFLANLAWFQWSHTESVQCWTFLRELLA